MNRVVFLQITYDKLVSAQNSKMPKPQWTTVLLGGNTSHGKDLPVLLILINITHYIVCLLYFSNLGKASPVESQKSDWRIQSVPYQTPLWTFWGLQATSVGQHTWPTLTGITEPRSLSGLIQWQIHKADNWCKKSHFIPRTTNTEVNIHEYFTWSNLDWPDKHELVAAVDVSHGLRFQRITRDEYSRPLKLTGETRLDERHHRPPGHLKFKKIAGNL